MAKQLTRRHVLRGSLAAAGLGFVGIPEWALPAPAEGEELVPFTDIPETFTTTPSPIARYLDIRKIDGPFTPTDQFFTVQHYGHPEIDGASFRLKVTGLVDRSMELTLDELRGLGATDLVAGFECSGNSPRPMQGLASNGRWSGVPLRNLLGAAGVQPQGKEIVFFGADRGTEKVDFRTQTYDVEQQYGRSVSVDQAMAPDPFLAYGLNGEPLTRHQGFPLRLIMPGWYGMANVKWLAQIHVQEERYLGKFQARWYRTLRGEKIGDEMKWKESRMQLKSVIARVTREGDHLKILGFVLNDGTALQSVEVRIDEGAWQPATIDSSEGKYSWKLFRHAWNGATPGEHTLVSRAIDVNGVVQPTRADLETKKTFLEDNAQFPRTVLIS
jgi:DMSO/TMAO reductase YedYZ molybdopterin-dependent catalytic subunit